MSKAGRVLLINLVMPFLQSLHTPIHISNPCQQRAASNDFCGALHIGCFPEFQSTPGTGAWCMCEGEGKGRQEIKVSGVFMFVGFSVPFLNYVLIPVTNIP